MQNYLYSNLKKTDFGSVLRIDMIITDDDISIVNLKCDTLMIGDILSENGVYSAYHMNKACWVTAALDGSANDETVKMLTRMSFKLTETKGVKLMVSETRLKQIRESEKQSHIEMYSNSELYKEGSWLRKPIKTILDIIPLFNNYSELNVLDLGCGVGRNCIAVAQSFKNIPCKIDCVDILDLAIEKLYDNAKELGVASSINGVIEPIENYCIKENKYDLVIAVSALEHIDSEQSFLCKLSEINRGIRKNGIVCLVINSDVKETEKSTGKEIPAQFEVNLQTEKLQAVLKETFSDFETIKVTVSEQQYDIPRGEIISDLKTKVVTFVARKK